MQNDKIDESTIKLITEIVIKILKEMNIPIDPAAAQSMTGQECCSAPECTASAPDPVIIPGRGCGRDLITEKEVMLLAAKKQTSIVCGKRTIITDSAADRLKAEGIKVIRR